MEDLKPWLRRMQEVRQSHGLSAEDTIPVFHSTDSYSKHRFKIMRWYVQEFKQARLRSEHVTPKADAAGTKILSESESPVKGMITITADPQHEVFQLQRALRTDAQATF